MLTITFYKKSKLSKLEYQLPEGAGDGVCFLADVGLDPPFKALGADEGLAGCSI